MARQTETILQLKLLKLKVEDVGCGLNGFPSLELFFFRACGPLSLRR